MRPKPSLRRRLTWYVVIALMTLNVLSGIAVYHGTRKETDEVFSAALVQTARVLDGLITRETLETSRPQLRHALARSDHGHDYERKLFLTVLDSDGSVLLNSRHAPELPDGEIESGFSSFSYKNKEWFMYALRSEQDDLQIVVGERSGVRSEVTEYIGSGQLQALLLLLPLLLFLLWHIVGVALKPLQAVSDQIREQDLRRLKPIDVDGVPREVSPLVDALNQMINDLDAAYLRERRFVSDASHELRNPLASLLINVDNAIEESGGREVLGSLQDMKHSIRRLSHLVSQLLALSHLEKADSIEAVDSVDLAGVCAGAIDALQAEADAASVTLELIEADTDCRLKGSRPLLESMVSNLVDNAIRYAGAGSRVELRCGRENGQLILSVDDSGPGLDAEQRQMALGRFYRVGDTNNPGAGLGLSIVDAIAQSHSGRVELSRSRLGGLCVTIRFELT